MVIGDNMKEIWKPVVGYEDSYEVSNLGRVKSIKETPFSICKSSDRIMKLYMHKKGYLKVMLYLNGKRKHAFVHRLVAEAFIPNPNELSQVNHKDGNKTNNCVHNLEWCTGKENIIHAVTNGLGRYGEQHERT